MVVYDFFVGLRSGWARGFVGRGLSKSYKGGFQWVYDMSMLA